MKITALTIVLGIIISFACVLYTPVTGAEEEEEEYVSSVDCEAEARELGITDTGEFQEYVAECEAEEGVAHQDDDDEDDDNDDDDDD